MKKRYSAYDFVWLIGISFMMGKRIDEDIAKYGKLDLWRALGGGSFVTFVILFAVAVIIIDLTLRLYHYGQERAESRKTLKA